MKKKRSLDPVVRILDREDEKGDLAYWLGRSPEERVDAVLRLRERYMRAMGHKTRLRVEAVVNIVPP